MTAHQFGRYDVIRVLGKGAMGVVYEARDPHLDRKVAIKTIRIDDLTPQQTAEYEKRFLTEARSVARLSHPGIVSVYDAGQTGDVTYLVMEYVPGVNLKHCLRHGVQFSPAGAVQIVLDVLTALGHAHEQKIIHRDVKPENILMDAAGVVKLTDFGIAKMLDAEVDNGTQVMGHSIGTPRYMSPEQVCGKVVDERSDVFSAGVLLYELLTATVPFDGAHHMAIASQILHESPPPPSSRVADMPEALDAVLYTALAKAPAERFQTAADFRAELARIASALPGGLAEGGVTSATQLVRADAIGMLQWLLDKALGTGLPGAGGSPSGGSGTDVAVSTSHAGAPTVATGETAGGDITLLWTKPPSLGHTTPPSLVAAATGSLHPSAMPEVRPSAGAATRSRWPLAAVLGVVLAVGGVGWSLMRSAPPTPVLEAPAPLTDPAQTLSAKEELVVPGAAPSPAVSPKAAEPVAAVAETPAAAPLSKPLVTGKKKEPAMAAATVTPPVAAAVGEPVPVRGSEASPASSAPVAGQPPAAAALPAEPCGGLSLFERESCLWKACFTDAYRSHAVCKRFHPEK